MNSLKYCRLYPAIFLFFSQLIAQSNEEVSASKRFAKVLISPGARFAEVQYVLSNQTENPWLIEGVESSCACASIDFPKTPNKAGAKVTLRATVVLGSQYGTLKETFLVSLSDGSPITQLVFEIERPKWIKADTESIIWSEPERELEKTFNLYLDGRTPSGWSIYIERPIGYELSPKVLNGTITLIGLKPQSEGEFKSTEFVYGVTKEGVVELVGKVTLRPFKR